ncbi:MAG: hypothetical protein JNM39_15560 [Bdellovibrionaceae bacterium]|nr:hypothetical protein [Pseudobdellovibrionaceae bacterium]
MKNFGALFVLLFSSLSFASQFVFDVGQNSPFVKLIESDPYHSEMYTGLVLEHSYYNYISVSCNKDVFTGKTTVLVNGIEFVLYTDLSGDTCSNELKKVFSALKFGSAAQVTVTYKEGRYGNIGNQYIFQKITAQ